MDTRKIGEQSLQHKLFFKGCFITARFLLKPHFCVHTFLILVVYVPHWVVDFYGMFHIIEHFIQKLLSLHEKKGVCLIFIVYFLHLLGILHVGESLKTSIDLGDQREHYTSFPLSGLHTMLYK